MREEQAMYRRLLHRRVYRLPPLPTLPGQVKRCRHCHGGGSQPQVSEEEREAMRKKLHQNWDEDDEEEVPE